VVVLIFLFLFSMGIRDTFMTSLAARALARAAFFVTLLCLSAHASTVGRDAGSLSAFSASVRSFFVLGILATRLPVLMYLFSAV
jgi:hypothetical protein